MPKSKKPGPGKLDQDKDLSELIQRKIQENRTLKKLMEYLKKQEEPSTDDTGEYDPDPVKKRRSS